VGYYDVYDDSTGNGFLNSNGTYTTLDYPGAIATYPSSINDAGWIVGSWKDSSDGSHCFLYKAGTFTSFDGPGEVGQSACYGINGQGEIVGSFSDGESFIDDAESGDPGISSNFTTMQQPGTSSTQIIGINNNGVMTGFGYVDNSGIPQGFFLNAGTFTDLPIPGAGESQGWGLNDDAQVVGYYADQFGDEYGFILEPPN
jgi:uncharacterized membrane protein